MHFSHKFRLVILRNQIAVPGARAFSFFGLGWCLRGESLRDQSPFSARYGSPESPRCRIQLRRSVVNEGSQILQKSQESSKSPRSGLFATGGFGIAHFPLTWQFESN